MEQWSFPPHFDVIVIGTGAVSTTLAASAGFAGRSVLQVDRRKYYSFQEPTFRLSDLLDWACERAAQSKQETASEEDLLQAWRQQMHAAFQAQLNDDTPSPNSELFQTYGECKDKDRFFHFTPLSTLPDDGFSDVRGYVDGVPLRWAGGVDFAAVARACTTQVARESARCVVGNGQLEATVNKYASQDEKKEVPTECAWCQRQSSQEGDNGAADVDSDRHAEQDGGNNDQDGDKNDQDDDKNDQDGDKNDQGGDTNDQDSDKGDQDRRDTNDQGGGGNLSDSGDNLNDSGGSLNDEEVDGSNQISSSEGNVNNGRVTRDGGDGGSTNTISSSDSVETLPSSAQSRSVRLLHMLTAGHDCLLAHDRSMGLDLSPKLLLARSPLVQLLVKSKVCNYMEFLAADGVAGFDETRVYPLPVTRADIFSCSWIGLREKGQLTKLLMFCGGQVRDPNSREHKQHLQVLGEYADRPFSEFVRAFCGSHCPPSQMVEALLTHVVGDVDSGSMPTAGVLARMRVHMESLGVYSERSAWLQCLYGGGEVTQAMSRACSVRNGVYALRVAPVCAVSTRPGGPVRGVLMPSGQFISCGQLVVHRGHWTYGESGDGDGGSVESSGGGVQTSGGSAQSAGGGELHRATEKPKLILQQTSDEAAPPQLEEKSYESVARTQQGAARTQPGGQRSKAGAPQSAGEEKSGAGGPNPFAQQPFAVVHRAVVVTRTRLDRSDEVKERGVYVYVQNGTGTSAVEVWPATQCAPQGHFVYYLSMPGRVYSASAAEASLRDLVDRLEPRVAFYYSQRSRRTPWTHAECQDWQLVPQLQAVMAANPYSGWRQGLGHGVLPANLHVLPDPGLRLANHRTVLDVYSVLQHMYPQEEQFFGLQVAEKSQEQQQDTQTAGGTGDAYYEEYLAEAELSGFSDLSD